jgi:hypothetical protein
MAQIVPFRSSPFRFPGGDARTCVLGATGSGKSTCALWLLSHQRLDRRPWVVFDFKREAIFDRIGFPPIQQLSLQSKPPSKPGLYLVSPRPGQDAFVDAFLWRVWEKENIGLFVDEAALMPEYGDAFPACLQQGRSKRIPIIACSQRPVGVARGLFSEANFFCVYRLTDRRDYKVIEGFAPADMSRPLPPYCWHWYDVAQNRLLDMSPVPDPETTADAIAGLLPSRANAWHPFVWTSRVSGREPVKLLK